MEDLMDCCIYILYWDINSPYIGQTVSLEKRKRAHINALKRGDHDNFKIQTQFNNLGSPPYIEVLQYCKEAELNLLEEVLINEFNSIKNGLNIISGGYSVGSGVHNPASLYSEEMLEKAYSLLTDNSLSYTKITEATGVPKSTLTKISTGMQHNWLKEKYPEKYEIIKEIAKSKSRFINSVCASSQGKKYRKIQDPGGKIYEVTNTGEFSRLHGLPNGNLCLVLTGKRNTVKGWRGID